MNVGYSIFNHAQFGHNNRTDCTQRLLDNSPIDQVPCDRPDNSAAFTVHKNRRNKPERGWAVELGLGLGPAFNKRRKVSE